MRPADALYLIVTEIKKLAQVLPKFITVCPRQMQPNKIMFLPLALKQ